MLANAQVSALDRLFYLPRRVPAPQALLPSKRPTTLPSTASSVTGLYRGTSRTPSTTWAMTYCADCPPRWLCPYTEHISGDKTPALIVRCAEVTKRVRARKTASQHNRGPSLRAATQSPTFGPPLVKAKAESFRTPVLGAGSGLVVVRHTFRPILDVWRWYVYDRYSATVTLVDSHRYCQQVESKTANSTTGCRASRRRCGHSSSQGIFSLSSVATTRKMLWACRASSSTTTCRTPVEARLWSYETW